MDLIGRIVEMGDLPKALQIIAALGGSNATHRVDPYAGTSCPGAPFGSIVMGACRRVVVGDPGGVDYRLPGTGAGWRRPDEKQEANGTGIDREIWGTRGT